MPRYLRKPTEIEAIQLNWKNWEQIKAFVGKSLEYAHNVWYILEDEAPDTCGEECSKYLAIAVNTMHGDRVTVRHGDWVARDGIYGTFYPINPDVFQVTYHRKA